MRALKRWEYLTLRVLRVLLIAITLPITIPLMIVVLILGQALMFAHEIYEDWVNDFDNYRKRKENLK